MAAERPPGKQGSRGSSGRRARVCLALLAALLAAPSAAEAGLPDDRAWELVSPPDKLGHDVLVNGLQARAAADGSAIQFVSLGGFVDVHGTGISVAYIAQRTAAPGTSGWATHAVTPPQDSGTFQGVVLAGDPGYLGELSPDLERGVFRAWSPLTPDPNVAHLPGNLYLREDARRPGPGAYRLLTDASMPLPAPDYLHAYEVGLSTVNGASADYRQILIETKLPLRDRADGDSSFKLYESDGPGSPRVLLAGPGCPARSGPQADRPCSGDGVVFGNAPHLLSADGSRTELTAPVTQDGFVSRQPGAASRIFQVDDHGTEATADDATIQLDASEASAPGFTAEAEYQDASLDGDRVFFTSPEKLTDAPGYGLYMWERQPDDEIQRLAIDAAGGTFALTARSQPTHGLGSLTSGSAQVAVAAGSFMPGQTVSAPGIPSGTTVGSASGSGLTLSQAASADVPEATIAAAVEATTPPLPFDATADQVQSALAALTDEATTGEAGRPLFGVGNVAVSGGPAGSAPFDVAFTGALHGVNVLQLRADPTGLLGPAPAATVATTHPVQNLRLIGATSTPERTDLLGASADGHRLYFMAPDPQLVPGAPQIEETGIYQWQDADGVPGGTLSFVAQQPFGDEKVNGWIGGGYDPKASRVTADGRILLFFSSAPADPGLFLYYADSSTPTDPDVLCASCRPGGMPAISPPSVYRIESSSVPRSTHLAHILSEDGRLVFFSTAEGLVPEDVDGAADAYVFDAAAGAPRLLSDGAGPSPSYFADASADGRDAFFFTRDRLSPWDVDENIDLYDARVGGGLPGPPSSPSTCSGEACRAPAPPPAAELSPTRFAGPGNRQHRRKHHRHRKRGRRAARHHHRHHDR